jgi:hypothetical protein
MEISSLSPDEKILMKDGFAGAISEIFKEYFRVRQHDVKHPGRWGGWHSWNMKFFSAKQITGDLILTNKRLMFYDHERWRSFDILLNLHDIASYSSVQNLIVNTKDNTKYEFLITTPKRWSAELDKLF